MKIDYLTVNPFGENVYVLWNQQTLNAVVVDPGMMRDQERDVITNFLHQHQLHVTHVLLTHLHLDHACCARWMAEQTGAQVWASPLDQPLGIALPQQVQAFHLKVDVQPLSIDCALNDGDSIMLDGEQLQVLAVPGHTPGGLVFYLPQSALLVSGDTIFQNSIGRTDLLGGDYDQLIASIHEKILTLPDETLIVPGHGHTTTVGDEKRSNPFL